MEGEEIENEQKKFKKDLRTGCSKGDDCPFRHEPAAKKNDTVSCLSLLKVFQPYIKQIFLQVCQFWLQEKCNKPHCKFRHLEDKRDPSVNR